MTEADKPLEELLLDLKEGRYGLVGLAKEWFDVLRKTEDALTMSEADLMKKSLEDVVSGKMSEKDIKNAKSKMVASTGSEDKDNGKSK